MTEAEIRKQICDFLATFPDRCLFTVNAPPRGGRVSNRWPPKGWSDVSGVWESRGLFIEVKTPTGTVYQHQIKFIERVRALGHIAFFATSVEDVKHELGL